MLLVAKPWATGEGPKKAPSHALRRSSSCLRSAAQRSQPSTEAKPLTQVGDELCGLAQAHLIREDGPPNLLAVEQHQKVDAHLQGCGQQARRNAQEICCRGLGMLQEGGQMVVWLQPLPGEI